MINAYAKLGIILLTIISTVSFAAPVYKVENGQNTLYLGGTMHVLSKDDYPLPAPFKLAYDLSDTVVFETDISAMNSPKVQEESIQLLTYTDGTSLDDYLSDETLAQLKAHLEKRGIPYESFKIMKPGLVGVTLSFIEMQLMGLNTQGVDAYFNTLALGDGKEILSFETPTEQLSFLAEMGTTNSDEFILYTLKDLENMPSSINTLKDAWRTGNLTDLEQIGVKDWAASYPDLYRLLLSDRNDKWMVKIKEMLNSSPTEYVLVGALHLAGEDGLIQQLQRSGYKVSQM